MLRRALALLLGAASAAAEVAQSDDWLVSAGPSKKASLTVTKDASGAPTELSLANGLVQRAFTVRGGALCTTEYKNLVSEQTFFRAISPEANLTLSGTAFDIGGCDGQPNKTMEFWTPDDWKANLTASPAAFQFHNYSQTAPSALFPWKPGTRHTPTAAEGFSWPPTGVHLELEFKPPNGAPAALAQVTVVVHYELYDGLPTFRKWVSVRRSAQQQGGDQGGDVTVDSLVMEILRAPNFAPERMSIITQQANNPTSMLGGDAEVKPELGQSFPGRTKQLWHFDPLYDQGHDQEIHVTYTYYTFLVVGYGWDETYARTGGCGNHNRSHLTGPGVLLTAGEEFSSLSVRTVLQDTNSLERQGMGVRKTMMTLAPSLMENPLIWMITSIAGYPSPSTPLRLAVNQAAATGHELLIIGFGASGHCGLCNAQMLNASWVSWFKSEVVGYAASKGVGISAYTLMQHNGWGEVVPPAEQALQKGKRAGVACMATGWFDTYKRNVLAFIKETGMQGLETDGQYEGYACEDAHGDHDHNGIHGSFSRQIQSTLDFNEALKGLGVYQTGADAYAFSGANKWNHADTDAFGRLPFWPRMTVGRMYIYDSTMNRVPASGQIGANDLASSSLACGAAGTAARVSCYDWGLASGYAMGTIPSFHAAHLWEPGDPDAEKLKALVIKWIGFFKSHRLLFASGTMLHIRRPDSRGYEAVGFAMPGTPTVISVFNPSQETITTNVTVPLYYSGLAHGSKVSSSREAVSTGAGGGATHVVGQEGGGMYDVKLPVQMSPASYAVFTIRASS